MATARKRFSKLPSEKRHPWHANRAPSNAGGKPLPRGGRETFCRPTAAGSPRAAQRVSRRLPAPHAGACRSARDCVPNWGHFSPTLRASPWCPIRPRVSRGDCLRGSFTCSARHPQTARPYPGPLDAIPRHPAIPRTQHHVGTFQRSTRQLYFRTQCVPRGASVSTLPVHSE